jgi:hypothetical protein
MPIARQAIQLNTLYMSTYSSFPAPCVELLYVCIRYAPPPFWATSCNFVDHLSFANGLRSFGWANNEDPEYQCGLQNDILPLTNVLTLDGDMEVRFSVV